MSDPNRQFLVTIAQFVYPLADTPREPSESFGYRTAFREVIAPPLRKQPHNSE